jgi:hypothetical protein
MILNISADTNENIIPILDHTALIRGREEKLVELVRDFDISRGRFNHCWIVGRPRKSKDDLGHVFMIKIENKPIDFVGHCA